MAVNMTHEMAGKEVESTRHLRGLHAAGISEALAVIARAWKAVFESPHAWQQNEVGEHTAIRKNM